jgi:hypothetical protein
MSLFRRFDPDAAGGGLQRGELVLLGGSQGIGKTITALQMARNVAKYNGVYAFYLSYEHPEPHLMNRLLCLESVNPPEMLTDRGLRMKDLQDIIVSKRARLALGKDATGSLRGILRDNQQTSPALARMAEYSDRLILLKASPAVTTLTAIREMIGGWCRQPMAMSSSLSIICRRSPSIRRRKTKPVTIIVEVGALALSTCGFAIVPLTGRAEVKRLHLFHLRGSSALDYECDIAIIMNNKYNILSKDHVAFNPYQSRQYREWVIFTIEKNRAGKAMIDVEFHLQAPYFAFDPHGQMVQQQLIDDKIIEA